MDKSSMTSDKKQVAVLERIHQLQDEITKAEEYLESGAHADWRGFRALFNVKVEDGEAIPPHRDWVRSTFIPRRARALRNEEKTLERLEKSKADRLRRRPSSPRSEEYSIQSGAQDEAAD